MTPVNLSRAAVINYYFNEEDTFVTPPVSFTIDSVAESFTGCTITMNIRSGTKLIKTLTNGAGIGVSGNALEYAVSAANVSVLKAGSYQYDVQKSDGSGIISTIQIGKIIVNDTE